MFGLSHREQAVEAATHAATSILRMQEQANGIPSGFWQDPYVLGFFGGIVGTMAKLVGGPDRMRGERLGQVLKLSFEKLMGSRADEVWRYYMDASDDMTDDFQRGLWNGNKVVLIAYGSRDFDNDDDVISAQAQAEQLDAAMAFMPNTEASSLVTMLIFNYLCQETRNRFG